MDQNAKSSYTLKSDKKRENQYLKNGTENLLKIMIKH